ncbi:MAG: hypothetical protein ACFB9M_12860 [Myxococcota bacterium]
MTPVVCSAPVPGRVLRSVTCLLMLLAAWTAPAAAWAQEEDVIRQADRTVYKQKTVIDFSDVTIQGELTKPQGAYLLNRRKTRFKSLLKTRANFLPELQHSIDAL